MDSPYRMYYDLQVSSSATQRSSSWKSELSRSAKWMSNFDDPDVLAFVRNDGDIPIFQLSSDVDKLIFYIDDANVLWGKRFGKIHSGCFREIEELVPTELPIGRFRYLSGWTTESNLFLFFENTSRQLQCAVLIDQTWELLDLALPERREEGTAFQVLINSDNLVTLFYCHRDHHQLHRWSLDLETGNFSDQPQEGTEFTTPPENLKIYQDADSDNFGVCFTPMDAPHRALVNVRPTGVRCETSQYDEDWAPECIPVPLTAKVRMVNIQGGQRN